LENYIPPRGVRREVGLGIKAPYINITSTTRSRNKKIVPGKSNRNFLELAQHQVGTQGRPSFSDSLF
jgi:hypothetical protein